MNIIEEVMNYHLIGIANIMHTLYPSIFVLGGGVMEHKKVLLSIVRTREYLYASMQAT